MEKELWWWIALKYFLHGILFSILILVLGIVWFVISAALVLIGSLLGLIIGVILLFLLIGGLNSFLTDLIWSIPIKTWWLSLLIHGLILFITLIAASIPAMIVNYNVPNLAVNTTLFIAQTLVNGFIAKKIAVWGWKEEYEEPEIEAPQVV